jgi:hypothetical protein
MFGRERKAAIYADRRGASALGIERLLIRDSESFGPRFRGAEGTVGFLAHPGRDLSKWRSPAGSRDRRKPLQRNA